LHKKLSARSGILELPHGKVETPVFMPIATRGAVKVAPFSVVKELGASIILGNTYHLVVRPGVKLIEEIGGLHKFTGWDGPILTDSGGFQIFSLSETRKISDDGVSFLSPVDGGKIFLTPESVIEAQHAFHSDISMVLDELTSLPGTEEALSRAVDRTTSWSKRAKNRFVELNGIEEERGLLFGIVQGGTNNLLRQRSAKEIVEIGFDGYAIGGLSVGEAAEDMYKTVGLTTPLLPEDKPRYLMGVGQPQDIVEAVRRGVDMFDCVLPTRNARHALLYSELNDEYLGEILSSSLDSRVDGEKLYRKINIRNNQYQYETGLVNPACEQLAGVSFAYLRHLFQIGEPMALYLATVNNLCFYLNLMARIREHIREEE